MIKFKSLTKILLIVFIVLINTFDKLNAQIELKLKDGRQIVCIAKFIDDKSRLILTKLDGNTDTIFRSDIVDERKINYTIRTNYNLYEKPEIIEIDKKNYYISIDDKDIIINKDSILSFVEYKKRYREAKDMIGVSAGFPYLLNAMYDRTLDEDYGIRGNFSLSLGYIGTLDFYKNIKTNENVEHNFSLSVGAVVPYDYFRYDRYNEDYYYDSSWYNSSIFIIGTSYDLKLYFLMLRAGIIYLPEKFLNNEGLYFLPNISVGLVFPIK